MANPSAGVRLQLSMRNASAVAANFRAFDAVFQEDARRLVRESGEFCRELTQFFCPVDTGFMRGHVKTTYSDDGLVFETGWLESDFIDEGLAFYPPHVEFGTVKMAAQPSLGPAVEEMVPRLQRDLAIAWKRSMRRGRLA